MSLSHLNPQVTQQKETAKVMKFGGAVMVVESSLRGKRNTVKVQNPYLAQSTGRIAMSDIGVDSTLLRPDLSWSKK